MKQKLFQKDSECQGLQDQMGRLQNNLAELTARIDPHNFNYTLDIKLNSDMLDDGLDCTASNKNTEQSIAHNNENVSMPESVISALHAVTNNENETVIYADELAIGLGPMLSGYMNHRKQFDFSRGRSRIDAGVELVQHIFGAWEDSRDAINIFCDLSKAFDCVYHETLIGKLRHYGVTGRALDLLKSYLSNRVQRVGVNVFLGIILDNRLQWGPHINELAKRLNSAAYAVKKMRNLSDVETARLVYFQWRRYTTRGRRRHQARGRRRSPTSPTPSAATVYFGCFHSLMSYGIWLWGNAADIHKIFVLQKRAVRAIY
ncbi:Probable RNA-directed DNA polymerase from transposon BS [Eumeta japonica]|uniref:Probable RNA-directed DNA polymerase from transposon BS n=1 Tax=Eumeta variegata TaxID=151549 RepID=A0A4C1SGT5_EUMVA|nr:Probable RNA-directed DNA polymerase from transposon BS [Eumeta japonica]